ncbi:hypothetical protein KAFR_0C05170 [Kazachstania africana CBS 2517]|uniref:Uncharacterized protein n=1 Tax=Kazachstania africana (strain ATCC 22294 / BCRC 22015 / CBS 2517 / CECT 1963 / NBRC 1671 / NRRL Y-8276) TaxID=1071382 RepID=H2AT08_KAZAF|nr:hypothetical protein KAFR_0C05170 [Kazachstania africana CBS 2517]CCF57508.1 hypothetical protein KAFR_0C05170 [Kazachstania africana CBS 2517]
MAFIENQYKPQLLDKNIYFGTLQTITKHSVLLANQNIRYFIGIDIPTETVSQLYNDIVNSGIYGSKDDILMINFDSKFLSPADYDNLQLNNDPLTFYQWNNTRLLNSLINDRLSLSQNFEFENALFGNKTNYTKSNVFTVDNFEKFQYFNDLIAIINFQNSNPSNGILIFADYENNENLITLLISIVLKKNPSLKILDALQFIKNLKHDNNYNLKEERIFWCSGLLNYFEEIRKNNLYWGISPRIINDCNNSNNIQNNNYNSVKCTSNKRTTNNIDLDNTNTNNNNSKAIATDPIASIARSKRARSD